MTKFKRVARYDETKAWDGMWFEPEDEMGRTHGQFKCALFEIGSPAWEAANDRALNETKVRNTGNGFRTPKKLSKREQADEDNRQFVSTFISMVLLDWRGVLDENDKEVAFSRDMAVEFFDVNDPSAMYIFRALAKEAGDIRNFQPDDQEGELPEGN